MHFFYIIQFAYSFLVLTEASGIVKSVMEDGKENVRTDFTNQEVKYNEFLECSYKHDFETIKLEDKNKKHRHLSLEPINEIKTPHRHLFILQCVEIEGSTEKFVILYFNALAVDRMVVTSCAKSDVQKSIFPPKLVNVMGKYYGRAHKHAEDGVSPQFRYKMEDGSCYKRKYRVELTEEKKTFNFINRKQPEILDTKSDSACGEVVFNECWTPRQTLTPTVKAYLDPSSGIVSTWAPYTFWNKRGVSGDKSDVNSVSFTRQLVCTSYQPGPKTSDLYFEIICVKAKESGPKTQNEFYAFVNKARSTVSHIERFTVKSCNEDEIVNAIFLRKQSDKTAIHSHLRFKHVDGKCYEREYDKRTPQVIQLPKEVDCPSNAFDWVNAKKDGYTMWGRCKGPQSTSGELEPKEEELEPKKGELEPKKEELDPKKGELERKKPYRVRLFLNLWLCSVKGSQR